MEKQAGKETIKDLEHLVKLLHKEWEHSGRKKAEVFIRSSDRETIKRKLAGEIHARQALLAMEGMDFGTCMELSKENFVLLRLAKKIKKALEWAGCLNRAVSVEMDQEEYRLYEMLMKE